MIAETAVAHAPPVKLTPVATVEGVLVYVPEPTVKHLNEQARTTTLTLRIGGDGSAPVPMQDAVAMLRQDFPHLTEAAAKARIYRAIRAGRIRAGGVSPHRTLDAGDLAAYRLAARDADLDSTDDTPGA